LSGKYPALLARRADAMLTLAEELLHRGLHDLAVLNAEYAAQLHVKALLYRVTGEEWRGHSIRQLLGVLALMLRRQGLAGEAERVEDFVKAYRRHLAELEEAHVRAVYGVFEYSEEQARLLLDTAKRVVELVKQLTRTIFGQPPEGV